MCPWLSGGLEMGFDKWSGYRREKFRASKTNKKSSSSALSLEGNKESYKVIGSECCWKYP